MSIDLEYTHQSRCPTCGRMVAAGAEHECNWPATTDTGYIDKRTGRRIDLMPISAFVNNPVDSHPHNPL